MQTVSGMPAGTGAVGTSSNPSPQPTGTTGLKKAYQPTPNSGGIIQAGNGGPVVKYTPPDAGYKGPLPTGRNLSQDQLTHLRSSKPAAPAPANRPPQTERANPLTNGGGTPQMEGTSVPVKQPTLDPGKAMGFSQRGSRVPSGDDTGKGMKSPDMDTFQPGDPNAPGGQLAPQEGDDPENELAGHVGGYGGYARSFTNPDSASIYSAHVNRLFGGPSPTRQGTTGLTRSLGKPDGGGKPRDDSNDDDNGY